MLRGNEFGSFKSVLLLQFLFESVHPGREFMGKEVSKVVHFEGVAFMAMVMLVVVGGDVGSILHVDLEAEFLLSWCRVGLAVGGLPFLPLGQDEGGEGHGVDGHGENKKE